MNGRPWRSTCANSECVEWRRTGAPGLWELRAKNMPEETIELSLDELGQVAQAYLDGEFGPVKVSRL